VIIVHIIYIFARAMVMSRARKVPILDMRRCSAKAFRIKWVKNPPTPVEAHPIMLAIGSKGVTLQASPSLVPPTIVKLALHKLPVHAGGSGVVEVVVGFACVSGAVGRHVRRSRGLDARGLKYEWSLSDTFRGKLISHEWSRKSSCHLGGAECVSMKFISRGCRGYI
jgi:hypothetical protein